MSHGKDKEDKEVFELDGLGDRKLKPTVNEAMLQENPDKGFQVLFC